MVRETASSDGFGRNIITRKLRTASKAAVSNGLQGECFAGQNAGLRLDVIVDVHHVVVGICARKGKNVGVLAIDLYFCVCNVDRLHAKRRDTHERNYSKHEGKNQPQMLAEDEQVIVKMRLAGREFKRGNSRRRNAALHNSRWSGIPRHDSRVFGHSFFLVIC